VRMELVSLFPFILEHLDRFAIAFGQDLCDHLSLHAQLHEQLMHNLTDGTQEESVSDEALQRSSDLLQLNLHHSTKTILRLFAANPAAVKVVRNEFERNTPEETKAFIAMVKEGKSLLLQRLLSTPFEEKQRQDYFTEMSDRCNKNEAVIRQLTRELEEATVDKEQEVTKRNEVIRKLKLDIHSIEKSADDHINRTKVDSEKQQQADEKNAETKKDKAKLELNQLRQQLSNITAEHRKSEQTLRGKKFQTETEVENWIVQYDSHMGEKQQEFEEIDAQYTQEKQELNVLEEKFATLQQEYDTIMEERRVSKEKREQEEKNVRTATKAALSIQRFWRAYKAKKALKKKGGKKGKKSGSKSGKSK